MLQLRIVVFLESGAGVVARSGQLAEAKIAVH